jgi:hypothetical protein
VARINVGPFTMAVAAVGLCVVNVTKGGGVEDRAGFYGVWIFAGVIAGLITGSILPVVAVGVCAWGCEVVFNRYLR